MSDLIVFEELVDAVKNQTFIKNGDVTCCEGLKYDFRLSNRILKADFKRPMDFSDTSNITMQKELFIRPNEVAFVLTEETLHGMLLEAMPREFIPDIVFVPDILPDLLDGLVRLALEVRVDFGDEL